MVGLDVVPQAPAPRKPGYTAAESSVGSASSVVLTAVFPKRLSGEPPRGRSEQAKGLGAGRGTHRPSVFLGALCTVACGDAGRGDCAASSSPCAPPESMSQVTLTESQTIWSGGTLRQHLVQLNPERQSGLSKVTHPTRSRPASPPRPPNAQSRALTSFRERPLGP